MFGTRNTKYHRLAVKAYLKSKAYSITNIEVKEGKELLSYTIYTTAPHQLIGRGAATVKGLARYLSEYWDKKTSIQIENSSLFKDESSHN